MKPPAPKPEPPAPEGSSFENFDRLFRSVVSVPKAAVEAEEVKERERNRNERERRKAAKKKP